MTATYITKPLATNPVRSFDDAGALHTLSSVGYMIHVGITDHLAETWFVYPVRKNLGPVGTMLDHVAIFTGPTAQADAVCAAFNQIAEDVAAETGKPEPTIAPDGNMAVGS